MEGEVHFVDHRELRKRPKSHGKKHPDKYDWWPRPPACPKCYRYDRGNEVLSEEKTEGGTIVCLILCRACRTEYRVEVRQ